MALLFQRLWHAAISLSAILLLLAACGGGDAEPTATRVPGTSVAPAPTLPTERTPTEIAADVTVEVMVGQLIMAAFSGSTAEGAATLVREYHVGNVTLLAANADTPEQVLAMTEGLQAMAVEANGIGMLISADQEGGRVIRLGPPFTELPAAAVIGCVGETEVARQAGLVTGAEMAAAGVNMNLAPTADVLTNPENTVIGDRAFGTTPDTVTPMVMAYVEGLRQAGVASTIKHFAGHGMTSDDSHDERIVMDMPFELLEQLHMPPFRAAAPQSDVLMTSHVEYLALDLAGVPASLSRPVMEFIRDDVGFDGVIITDALEMRAVSDRWDAGEAAVLAIEAGADIALYSGESGAIEAAVALAEAVRSGRISEERVAESHTRVVALKGRLLGRETPPLSVVGSSEHAAFVDLLSDAAVQRGC
jgi:beta-N-acetylhexosaminidase